MSETFHYVIFGVQCCLLIFDKQECVGGGGGQPYLEYLLFIYALQHKQCIHLYMYDLNVDVPLQ